jgi:hypothetical protein
MLDMTDVFLFQLTNGKMIIGTWGNATNWDDEAIEVLNPYLLIQQQDPQDPSRAWIRLAPHMLGNRIHLMLNAVEAFSSAEDFITKGILTSYQEAVTGLVLPEGIQPATGGGTVVKFNR